MKSDRTEIPYDTPYMWNLKRNDTNTLIYEIEADSENKLMVAGGKNREKGYLGSLGSTCTLCYI